MAVRKQKAKASLDAHELVKKAQALSTHLNTQRIRQGSSQSNYLNQVPILGDKGVITPHPNLVVTSTSNLDTRRKSIIANLSELMT